MKQPNEDDDVEAYGPSHGSYNESNGTKQTLSYPFYNYQEYSNEPDADPTVPLTAPGRVPNFPAKMHAILSRDDLSEIVGWMPHGRAWKVFKPREFEVLVLPTYFEHAKFSSFIRQANGWGFRRINTGCDRNCYYHPRFLRGLPHLCKGMKRPGVAQKLQANPKHEPDLYKISDIHPLPERENKETVIIFSTLAGGNKTCLSIGSNPPAASIKSGKRSGLTPREFEALSAFYSSLSSIDGEQRETRQEFSMQTTSNAMVPLSNFNLDPIPISSYESCMRPFQSLSDANKMAFCNRPNIFPTSHGNSMCTFSHSHL